MPDKATATQTALAPIAVGVVTPKDLIERFNKIYNEIANRAFSIFENDGRIFGRDLEHWLKAEAEILHPVPVNVTEADAAVKGKIQAEVPGFEAKDLKITLEPHRLILSGKRETTEEATKDKSVYKEQRSNEIFRTVPLPVEVDASKASATLKNGLLEVQAPKSTKPTTAQVEVKTA